MIAGLRASVHMLSRSETACAPADTAVHKLGVFGLAVAVGRSCCTRVNETTIETRKDRLLGSAQHGSAAFQSVIGSSARFVPCSHDGTGHRLSAGEPGQPWANETQTETPPTAHGFEVPERCTRASCLPDR